MVTNKLDAVIGQQRPRYILQQALENERVPHAYLFYGPMGVGKEALALEFTKALFCQSQEERPCQTCSSCRQVSTLSNPDLIYLFPSPKELKVEEERAVLQSIAENPYAREKPWSNPTLGIDRIRLLRKACTIKSIGKYRMIIIAEAEKMTAAASNALLKILEEPPENTFIILTTDKLNMLLSTIISRCQIIQFGLIADAEIEKRLIEKYRIDAERARLLSRLSQGSYSRALEWLDDEFEEKRQVAITLLRTFVKDFQTRIDMAEEITKKYDKQAIKEIFSLILIWFRDAFLLYQGDVQSQQLINVDRKDVLHRFVHAFETIDFDRAFTSIEHYTQLIDRNVHQTLLLVCFLIKLETVLEMKR